MFPNLAERFGDIAEVTVAPPPPPLKPSPCAATERRGVVERIITPSTAISRRLLVALDQLKVLEAKTRDPKRFERIDLRDLSTLGARRPGGGARQSRRVSLTPSSASGGPIWPRPGACLRAQIREQQTWLAEGDLDLRTGPVDWLNREITNIPADDRAGAPDRARRCRFGHHDDKLTTKFGCNIPDTVTLVSNMPPEHRGAGVQYLQRCAGRRFGLHRHRPGRVLDKNGLYTRRFRPRRRKFWTRFAFRGDKADRGARWPCN